MNIWETANIDAGLGHLENLAVHRIVVERGLMLTEAKVSSQAPTSMREPS